MNKMTLETTPAGEGPNWLVRRQLGIRPGDLPFELVTSRVERILRPAFLTLVALGGFGYAVYDAWIGDWKAFIGGIALGIAAHMLFRWIGVRTWAWLTRDAVLIPVPRRTKARFRNS